MALKMQVEIGEIDLCWASIGYILTTMRICKEYTVCFTDLGKLNLANFRNCPSCLKNKACVKRGQNRLENNRLANNDLNP